MLRNECKFESQFVRERIILRFEKLLLIWSVYMVLVSDFFP